MTKNIIEITKVKPMDNYTLFLRFSNGKSGKVNIAKLIPFKGIFKNLKEKRYFRTVLLNSDIGTICWKNGADLAPSYLYENLT
jgi:hypothetical protein